MVNLSYTFHIFIAVLILSCRVLSYWTHNQHDCRCMSSPCSVHTCIFGTHHEMQFSWVYICLSTRTILRIFSCMIMWVPVPFHSTQNHLEENQFYTCLVKMWKYALRTNPLVRKMPLVFLCGCVCVAIAECVHDIHVRICNVGKYKMCY